MSLTTMEQIEERLSEIRSQKYDIEENSGRYYELGEYRISGYDSEEEYDELCDEEDELLEKLSKLEDEECDE